MKNLIKPQSNSILRTYFVNEYEILANNMLNLYATINIMRLC